MSLIEPQGTIEKMALERLRVGALQGISNYILLNMEVEQVVDYFGESVALRFQSEVLAKTLGTTRASSPVTFEHPVTTWQMFKHSHRDGRWLGWLARRWPVRMESVTKYADFEIKDRAAFPDCTIQFPKRLGSPVFIQNVEAI